MRVAAALIIALVVATGPAVVQAAPARYWSLAKLLRRIDGARIHIGTRTVRVVSASTLCAGTGASIRRDGVRRWRRFICTYTTFTKAGVDRDLDFRVRVLGVRRYRIYDAHWVSASR
jgi:hypothetical protein